MEPVKPVLKNARHVYRELNVAETQPQYKTLPAIVCDAKNGTLLTRWRLTFRERLRLLFTGDLYVFMTTFGHHVQPISIQVERPVEEPLEREAARS